eukprot:14085553-Alexandrium_andersonii.AAC.2
MRSFSGQKHRPLQVVRNLAGQEVLDHTVRGAADELDRLRVDLGVLVMANVQLWARPIDPHIARPLLPHDVGQMRAALSGRPPPLA